MRLIDADALIDDLEHDVAIDQDTLDFEELTEINRANIQFDKDCKQNAIDLLKNAPTIEPERKKGEWVHGEELSRLYIGDACVGINYEDFHCSACNVVIEEPCKPTWNYCPNCGAYMRGDEDD